jgi:hypothetical protein
MFREASDERGKTGLMIFAVKPLLMPSLEGRFRREVEEVTMRAGLNTDTTYNISLSGSRLVFQEKIVLEERKIRVDGEIELT